MPLQIWTGQGRFQTQHENDALDQIILALQRRYGETEERVDLVFNFHCARCDIDLAIFKSNAIAIIELKRADNPFDATVNGAWKFHNGGFLKGGREENPFQQLKNYRYRVIAFLEKNKYKFLSEQKAKQAEFESISGIIAIWPTLHSDSIIRIGAYHRWFHLVGNNQLVDRFANISSEVTYLELHEISALLRDVLNCRRLTKVSDASSQLSKPKVFICYSENDNDVATRLKEELEESSLLEVKAESHLLAVSAVTEEYIASCDHTVFLLTDSSWDDEYVSRVLGLVAQLHRKRRNPRPSICGVLCQKTCTFLEFSPRAWDGKLLSSTINFENIQRFRLGDPSLEQWLMVKATFIDLANETHHGLLQKSRSVYENLFADEDRSDWEEIESWLEDNSVAAQNGSPWRETYGVLHTAANVIGMTYISGHSDHEWQFGSYFAVQHEWRKRNRAKQFLAELSDHLQKLIPKTKGVVFEVDPVQPRFLTELSARTELGNQEDHDHVIKSLLAAKRICFYERLCCVVFLTGDGEPLPYLQPAMEVPLRIDTAHSRILMVHLFDPMLKQDIIEGKVSTSPMVESMINFIYDFVYEESYGDDCSPEIPGYSEYVNSVKTEVYKSSSGWHLGILHLENKLNELIRRARQEGWEEQLTL